MESGRTNTRGPVLAGGHKGRLMEGGRTNTRGPVLAGGHKGRLMESGRTNTRGPVLAGGHKGRPYDGSGVGAGLVPARSSDEGSPAWRR